MQDPRNTTETQQQEEIQLIPETASDNSTRRSSRTPAMQEFYRARYYAKVRCEEEKKTGTFSGIIKSFKDTIPRKSKENWPREERDSAAAQPLQTDTDDSARTLPENIESLMDLLLRESQEKWSIESESWKKSLAIRSLTIIFALVAGSNYAGAAMESAKRGLVPLDPITTAIITTIAASAVLVNTTEQSRLWYLQDKIPAKIKNLFPPKSNAMSSLENVKVFALSFIASMPLTSTTAAYSASLPLWVLIPLLVIVQTGNTGMHTLPVYLVLKGPWIFRFPIVPFELLCDIIAKFFAKPETAEELILKENLAKTEQLIGKLSVRLTEKMTLAIEKFCDTFKLSGCEISFNSLGHPRSSEIDCYIGKLMSQDDKELNSLSLNFLRGPFRKMTEIFGSLWLLSGSIQFSWVVNDVFKKWFKSEVASITIAVSSGYTFGVLVTFLGGLMMVDFVNRILKGISGTNILSTAVNFYPLFFLVILAPIIFCSGFSYGAGAVITEDYFKDKLPGAAYLCFLASGCASLVFLGLQSLSEFVVAQMSEYARHFGSYNQKDLIQFEQRVMPQVIKWLQLMDRNKLLEIIKGSSPEQLELYFGEKVSFEESSSQLQPADEERQNGITGIFSFFGGIFKKRESQSDTLIEQSQSLSEITIDQERADQQNYDGGGYQSYLGDPV